MFELAFFVLVPQPNAAYRYDSAETAPLFDIGGDMGEPPQGFEGCGGWRKQDEVTKSREAFSVYLLKVASLGGFFSPTFLDLKLVSSAPKVHVMSQE